MSNMKSPSETGQSGGRARPGSPEPVSQQLAAEEPALDILHLAELVPMVRTRFGIEQSFPDDAILASLKSIAAASSDRERSTAAFASNLGRYLDCGSQSQTASLSTLIAMLPPARS